MTRSSRQRSGSIVVFTAVMMVFLFGLLAFALDIGYLQVVQTEMKRTADSAALAAAWKLLDEDSAGRLANNYPAASAAVSGAASHYATANVVAKQAATLAVDDVAIGQLTDPSNPSAQLTFGNSSLFNAVRVRVRKTSAVNGEIPFFFGNVFGLNSTATQVEATAMYEDNFVGFQIPSNGENLGILPFALKKQSWDAMLAGQTTDEWGWNEETETIEHSPDGILEVNLYPQATGASGNCGTVDIGSPNNSTADIARQIVYGINATDLSYLGGTLELGEDGELYLNGDTGISAGVKDELDSMRGKPRIVPVYSQVSGPGNNAQYTIVQFVGIRILEVELTGSKQSKHVTIQPARVVTRGAIPAPGGATQHSYAIYSPAWLVR